MIKNNYTDLSICYIKILGDEPTYVFFPTQENKMENIQLNPRDWDSCISSAGWVSIDKWPEIMTMVTERHNFTIEKHYLGVD